MDSVHLSDVDQDSPDKFLNAMADSYLLQDAILNATESAIVSIREDGVITSINKATEPMLGYVANELVGKQKLSLFHDAGELAIRQNELRKAGVTLTSDDEVLVAKARQHQMDHTDWTYRRKNGTTFPVSLSMTGIWNDRGELQGFLAIITDITDQKSAEIARAESERKFKMLAENIQCTVYLCRNDEKYSMVYLNDQVELLTGYSPSDFISGRVQMASLYHPEDSPRIYENFDEAIRRKEGYHLVYRLRHKSGEWKWIDEAGIGIYEGDKLTMMEGFMVDVTEQKVNEQELKTSKINLEAATQELRNQNQQLNEFAHIIAHNLRSPVGNIGALISLLNEKSTIHDYQSIFDKLKMASRNLQETLNELMEILMIQDESQLERVNLDFEEVFRKTKNAFSGDIIKYTIAVTCNFTACRRIQYSKTYLESIFLNLLSNAIKYRDPKRMLKVHFETAIENGEEVMRVSDNAQGIDLGRHGKHLFGLRKTFHEHKDARGVGLFLTKTQVESMGGRISAESEVGKGTIFTIRFSN